MPSASAFDAAVHLAWGDVATDEGPRPVTVRVSLKRSKTDQFGRGVQVFMGATGDELCPVEADKSALRGGGQKCLIADWGTFGGVLWP